MANFIPLTPAQSSDDATGDEPKDQYPRIRLDDYYAALKQDSSSFYDESDEVVEDDVVDPDELVAREMPARSQQAKRPKHRPMSPEQQRQAIAGLTEKLTHFPPRNPEADKSPDNKRKPLKHPTRTSVGSKAARPVKKTKVIEDATQTAMESEAARPAKKPKVATVCRELERD